MNPMEILSMIEEAAGTRMFETKKQAALKTMERKQQKNEEVWSPQRDITLDLCPSWMCVAHARRSSRMYHTSAPPFTSQLHTLPHSRNMHKTCHHTHMKTTHKHPQIDRVLTEEITPTLEKLRMEKGNYLTFMANETKIERSERFCVAYEYKKATDTLSV
jgi:chromosome segregation ATPase